jgi:hypothetical protein
MGQIDETPTRDKIVEEIRRIKDSLAQPFDYDVHRILEDAREKQKMTRRKIIPAPIHSNN